ncbi:MAG: ribosomal-processing cysteine protease Prp [Clostridiaceae bacterium]|nr:ribosomal-processing cysteine protease Prp [Clostridiaceae bacterium]
MIRARFKFDDEQRVYSFHLTGHADYSEAGKDIYCSAVSAIAQTVIGTLTEFFKPGQDFIYTLNSGDIECQILDYATLSKENRIRAESLMFSAYIGIKQIDMIAGQKYLSVLKEEEHS